MTAPVETTDPVEATATADPPLAMDRTGPGGRAFMSKWGSLMGVGVLALALLVLAPAVLSGPSWPSGSVWRGAAEACS